MAIMSQRWVNANRINSEYMLWTDASSREFIAKEFPWFIDTFDAYTYPIQRADAIRYFVLYHYGGVYLDLDVGCRRPLDQLLSYSVILPKTIPVGVSNDLMFAEKNHPFMDQTIHNLITFDHSWVLNYPTVMFSTGPMFLSAQYGLWTSSHPPTPDMPGGEVRILPKSLYGKNAKPEEAPHAFFSHYYGSSWHADDAAFIGFLGKWGKGLMWIGFIFLVAGVINLLWRKKSRRSDMLGRSGGYEVLLPRTYQRNDRWHIDLGLFTLTSRGFAPAATSSVPPSPADEDSVPMLPIAFNVRAPSPSSSDSSGSELHTPRRTGIVDALTRASNRVLSSLTGNGREGVRGRPTTRRGWQSRGVLFFLPAIFTPSAVTVPELGTRRPSHASATRSASTSLARAAQYPPEKEEHADQHGTSSGLQQSSVEGSSQRASRPPTPGSSGIYPAQAPPPYPNASGASAAARSRIWNAEGSWEDWDSRS